MPTRLASMLFSVRVTRAGIRKCAVELIGVLAVWLLVCPIVKGASIIDQENLAENSYFTLSFDTFWQQEVTAGLSGRLTQIDIYLAELPGTFQFELYATGGLHHGGSIFSELQSPTVNSHWYSIDVSQAALDLTVGQQFAFGVRSNNGLIGCCGLGGGPNYPGGLLYLSMVFNNPPVLIYETNDLAFRTYVSVVPEPATLTLLGVGLAGLGFSRRRRPN